MKAFKADIDFTMNMNLSRPQLAGILQRLVESENDDYVLNHGTGIVYCENAPAKSAVYGIEWIEVEQESETKEG